MNARSLVFGSAGVFVLTLVATPVNITAQQSAAPATHLTYAKVLPYLGQQVEITGTEVTLSNNYDVRSFELQSIKRKGK